MFLIILSLIDIAVGICLLFPNSLGFYLGIIASLKGISSTIGGIAMKESVFVILGIVDIIAGLMLVFNFGIPWFWVIPTIKGIYSLIVGLGGR
jgi:uncharacterized membrane protein HdeD (DUF308 family)